MTPKLPCGFGYESFGAAFTEDGLSEPEALARESGAHATAGSRHHDCAQPSLAYASGSDFECHYGMSTTLPSFR